MTPKYNVRRLVPRFFCREWHRRPNILHVMKKIGENIKLAMRLILTRCKRNDAFETYNKHFNLL